MIYVFDGCELNDRLYTIQRAGQTTRLRPKVFQVLLYLIEHRDRVVSKQELADHVWLGQFIADATLESTVRAVRQVLGDSGREQRMIQTLSGHGYRFIGLLTSPVEARNGNELQDKTDSSVAREEPVREATETVSAPVPILSFCPACGIENRPQANYCSSCGAVLAEPSSISRPASIDPSDDIMLDQSAPPAPPSSRGDASEAERRQLTVMSCDLVDAATLLDQLELEDLRDVVRSYQDMCVDVTHRFDGHIAQQLGNKLLIYFGYPLAHEDDAQRAVRAGLGIIESLEALNARLMQEKGVRLAVRLGIHTGLVVVGELDGGDRHEPVAFGEPPNIADQIQGIAPANTVVISPATAHLVQGYFTCQDLGLHMLTGRAEPVRLSRVMAASGAQSRLDIVSTVGLTPFVGRDTEIALLLERWAQVKDGSGHVVLLSGEAGIGKSRLIRAMKERLEEDVYIQLECRCLPYYQQSALYPVIELFHYVLQWHQEDTPDEKLKKLETVLTQYSVSLEQTVPLLAALLSLPHPDRYPPLQLTSQQQRQRTLGAILTLLLALTARQPVLLIVEDLHWLDPSTLELLTLIVEQTPTASICILLTFRPTFEVPWGNRSYVTQITLVRLSRPQVEQMVTHITGGKPFPGALLQQVVDQTDGVPLFVEECTKSILETGLLQETEDHYELTEPLPTLTIPTTLHDSLMARLDRLDTAKSIAQLGATIGRRVPYALLQAVWQQDEEVLQRELERLVEAELVYQRGLPPQAVYVFKHALIQETAYQSLLKRTREHYHQRIAQVLVEQFPETAALQPELLAHHYTEAGLRQHAIPYWQQAGELAVERSANAEAISHFTKALELLKTLPETPERVQQELSIQLAIGSPLLMLKGHTAPEIELVYSRAYELAQQLGETPQRFSVLVGLQRFYYSQARLGTARELAEQCFTLAQRLGEPTALQEAHQILGSTFFFIGDQVATHEHLEQGIALYNPQQSSMLAFTRGTDPGVVCLARSGWGLWWLGYPDMALTRSHEAVALAQRLSHPYSLSFAMHYHAILHVWRWEVALAKVQLEAAMAFMQEHGFVQFLAAEITKLGWVLVEQGDIEEGMAKIHQGLEAHRIHGVELGRYQNLAILAYAYGRRGQAKEGLRILAEAFDIAHNNVEGWYEAELHRLKGDLLLQSGIDAMEEAEANFRQAIVVARQQSAKSLELRAVMSLGRLWQHQGKSAAAHQMLAEIYSWFTEGFDTPDLQHAKTLLEALQ